MSQQTNADSRATDSPMALAAAAGAAVWADQQRMPVGGLGEFRGGV
jgi:hypothetical protein